MERNHRRRPKNDCKFNNQEGKEKDFIKIFGISKKLERESFLKGTKKKMSYALSKNRTCLNLKDL